MDAGKIYNKISDILRIACNHRYISNLPVNPQRKYAVAEKITSRQGGIVFPKRSRAVSFIEYRLPQTRIYCREYEQDYIKYTFIEYFDTVFLLIHNNLPTKPIDLSLMLSDAGKLICSTKIKQSDQQNITFRLDANALFLFGRQQTQTWQELPAMLTNIIENEYKIHPLSKTNCTDGEMLEQVDGLWAKLEMIDAGGDIIIAEYEKLSSEASLLLSEIYFHLGEEKRFEAFIESPDGLNLSDKIIAEAAEKTRNDSPLQKAPQFFEMLFSEEQPVQDILRAVQEYWEKISLPAMECAMANQVRDNARECIAFALLAIYHNFWWMDILYDKLISLVSDPLKTLLALLFTLKKMVAYRQEKDGFTIRAGSDHSSNCYLENCLQGFSAAFTGKKEKYFSVLDFKDELHCRISRSVIFSLSKAHKVLKISPVVPRPPLSDLEFNTVKIIIDGYTVEIPLAWRQFEVTINGVRIKFLQKKKRFQLTFRQRKDFPLINLNDSTLDFGGDKKLTIALDIKRQASRLHIYPFFLPGRAVQASPGKMERFMFCGTALDCQGIIGEDVNVAFGEARHSNNIAAGKKGRHTFSVPYDLRKYRLTARKCTPEERTLSENEPVLKRMLHTPAHILKNELTIFLMDDKRQKREEILIDFYKKFAFYPRIEAYSRYFQTKTRFSLLVGDEAPKPPVASFNTYKIVRIKNRQILFIPEMSFARFLEDC